ncbi:MAG: nitrogenase component 1 [Elusimicrobiota bacterium]
MESIVFFGKGGIGKSTLASNVSAVLAAGGGRVLHIGCDPKMDSTLSLMGRHIQPFSGSPGPDSEARLRGFISAAPVRGVHCIEAGGPQPGVGCAGTGIGAMLDAIKGSEILEKEGYTAAVFDVLGDVVCGGFAAPLRRGFARKVVIVVSEELLSLYSANKLILMVENYARNGVYLAGLAINAKDAGGIKTAMDFAAAVNARVLGVIPRDPAVAAAERRRVPVVLASPKSAFSVALVRLCAAIRSAGPQASPPKAMTDHDFSAFIEGRLPASRPFSLPASRPSCRPAATRNLAAVFIRARLKPVGTEGGQMICEWTSPRGTLKVILAPAAGAQAGMTHFSDWAVCFHPASAGVAAAAGMGGELAAAAAGLAGFKYAQLLGYFGGSEDYCDKINSLSAPENKDLPSHTPIRPHMGFGQWQRFFFPSGSVRLHIPQGSVMVEHGDSECRFSCCDGGALGFFRERAGLGGFNGPLRGPMLPKTDPCLVNTDFGAQEGARGDDALISDSLDHAARRAGAGGLIEFYTGCSPLLLASDTAGLARRISGERGVTVVMENYNSFYEYAPAKARARAAFMTRRLSAFKGVKHSVDVNLVDFGECREELVALLERTGLTTAMPAKSFYDSARSARLQVLSASDAALCAAFDAAGIKWIVPSAPYGFTGVRAWLKEISAALGRRSTAAGPSPEEEKERRALRSVAGRYRAGFVVASEELALLAGGTLSRDVPVLPVVLEAGFGADLLVHAPDPAARVKAAAAAVSLGRTLKAPLKPRFFSSPAQLDAMLRRPRAMKLVYSDIRLDPRVVVAGRSPFSAALFEPGYDGALETVRRLLELCECDFNEKYLGA